MEINHIVQRAQLYCFLADAFVYPGDNWLEDLPALHPILGENGLESPPPSTFNLDLDDLQQKHLQAFGLTGSLCYETECGLPNEFRQSQEMADIAGFYNAFGFRVGGALRERPDHLATQLEFLYVLSLKEAYAAEEGHAEHVEVCVEARRSFLRDHLGRWIGLFAEGVTRASASALDSDEGANPYVWLARQAADFVLADARSLGVTPEALQLRQTAPTPIPVDLNCAGCPVAE